MTYNEFMSAINSDVERILTENSANIAHSLLQGLSETEPCISKEQLQIIRNAVNTSIQSSVQIMFDYLNFIFGLQSVLSFKNGFQTTVIESLRNWLSTTEWTVFHVFTSKLRTLNFFFKKIVLYIIGRKLQQIDCFANI